MRTARRAHIARRTAAVIVLLGGMLALAASAAVGAAQKETPGITDYVKYVHGKPGKANPNLAPIKIGWSNNEGGSVVPIGLTSTAAAEFAVKWINDHASGIGGHPLQLVKCMVKNAEEEGLKCGQQFLNDKDIKVVAYGALGTGATTVNSTIAGKKPIILSFSVNASDTSNPNTYILFGAGQYTVFGWGALARDYLHAKTAAVIFPEGPGIAETAAGVRLATDAVGIKTKFVAFNPKSTDLTGALTAAGVQDAGMIAPMVAAPEHCLAVYRGLKSLGIDPAKVVSLPQCTDPSLKKAYGGDFPKWIYGIAQSGDGLINPPNAAGKAFKKALAQYGKEKSATDPWYPAVFSQILTIAQFMNSIGADKITEATIAAKAKAFQGPLVMGGQNIQCGKYPAAPANCSDGDAFFRYQGNGKFKRIIQWIQAPKELQKKLHARPRGNG